MNVRLFCVIAALSERIKMLEPVIRKLINQLDFEALQVYQNHIYEQKKSIYMNSIAEILTPTFQFLNK